MKNGRVVILDLFGTILNNVSNDFNKGLEWLRQNVLSTGTSFDSVKRVADRYYHLNMRDRTATSLEANMLKQLELFDSEIGYRIEMPFNEIEYGFFYASRVTSIADGLLNLLEYLTKKGFSIYVMSNTIFSASTIKQHLDMHGLLKYFSDVYTSGDCGYRKPSNMFFDFVFNKIKSFNTIKKENIIFIGNSLEKDMLGASKFGFDSIWISSESNGIGEQLANCVRVEDLSRCKDYIESNYLSVAGISKNYSTADGPGNRIPIYLQGCNLRCDNCQNRNTWNEFDGEIMSVRRLVSDVLIKMSSRARNITISGGEPLFQQKALITLLNTFELVDVNVCLYTGHEFEKIPEQIKNKVHYLKTNPYVHSLKTTTEGFYGSTNQKFWKKGENGEWEQIT